jgi:enamine deaminase RidA (YjgF/YER057c/UK114 family)
MQATVINATDAPQPVGGYAQAVDLKNFSRLLVISGQIPVRADDGSVPADFTAQCRLAWGNVVAQLRAAGLAVENLIKVTIFLSDRRYAAENRAVRQEVLGAHPVALTVIITGIFDEKWLLEIEAMAAE